MELSNMKSIRKAYANQLRKRFWLLPLKTLKVLKDLSIRSFYRSRVRYSKFVLFLVIIGRRKILFGLHHTRINRPRDLWPNLRLNWLIMKMGVVMWACNFYNFLVCTFFGAHWMQLVMIIKRNVRDSSRFNIGSGPLNLI